MTQDAITQALVRDLTFHINQRERQIESDQYDLDLAYREGDGIYATTLLARMTIHLRIKELLEVMLVECNAKGGPSADTPPSK